VDNAGDIPKRDGGLGERVHRLARGHVHGRGAHLESCIAQNLGRRIGVLLAQVSQQDMFARAHPPGDCLADGTGSDDDNDVAHDDSPS